MNGGTTSFLCHYKGCGCKCHQYIMCNPTANMLLSFVFVLCKAYVMKSTEVLNPRRSDIKTGRLVHTHKLTAYYIHCGDTFLRCIIIALNYVWNCYGKNQTSRSRETQKKNLFGRNFYMTLITQKKISRTKEGSNWERPGILLIMKQQRYHLRYLEKLTHLYGIPSGIHSVYGECTCDKMADLMVSK